MPRAPACPFYGGTHKERIVCLRDGAGTMGRGELRMDFPSQVCRLRYWMQHCCDNWESCSLSPALAMEYEEHANDKPTTACYNKTSKQAKKHIPSANYKTWTSPSGLRKVEDFSREGLNKEQIANRCGCHVTTLRNWERRCPELTKALERGRKSQ